MEEPVHSLAPSFAWSAGGSISALLPVKSPAWPIYPMSSQIFVQL